MNPVHQDLDGWWFWDETWADRYGPFESREAAAQALEIYCRDCLGHQAVSDLIPDGTPRIVL